MGFWREEDGTEGGVEGLAWPGGGGGEQVEVGEEAGTGNF